MPENVETAVALRVEATIRNRFLVLAASGAAYIAALILIAERMYSALLSLTEVNHADMAGVPQNDNSIEVSEPVLCAHLLAFDEVSSIVRRYSIDIHGSTTHGGPGDIQLHTIGQSCRGTGHNSMVLSARCNGTPLLPGGIATVGFTKSKQFPRFDQTPAVMLYIFRTGIRRPIEKMDRGFLCFTGRREAPPDRRVPLLGRLAFGASAGTPIRRFPAP